MKTPSTEAEKTGIKWNKEKRKLERLYNGKVIFWIIILYIVGVYKHTHLYSL